MKRDCLSIAADIQPGERQKSYGHPYDNFKLIGKLWASILGVEVTNKQVALCMMLLKIARECHAHKQDNLVDIAGYARALEVLEERAEAIAKGEFGFIQKKEK